MIFFQKHTLKNVSNKNNVDFLISRMRTLLVAMLFMVTGHSAFCAEDSNTDLGQYVQKITTIKQVRIVLIPQSMSFRRILSEGMFMEIGCSFDSKDKNMISNLQEILNRSDLRFSKNEKSIFDLRYGIFLTLSDGSEEKFLFGEPYAGQNAVGGKFSQGLIFKNSSFTALSSLPLDLIDWVQKIEPSGAKDSSMRNACRLDDFKKK